MIIYKITNKINGKSYIGKTKRTLEERFKQHIKAAKNNKKYILSRSIRKYGVSNFEISIINMASTDEELSLLEMKYIEEYRTYIGFEDCNGYNMTLGGEGGNTNGNHPNKEFIYKKISESNSGENNYLRKLDIEEYEEHLNKYLRDINNPMYGYVWSEEQRKLKSELASGENNPFYNKKHTEESKRKMRKNSKGKNSGEKNCNFGKTGWKNHRSKEYIITTPEGQEIYVKGLSKFCKDFGLIGQCLGSVARGITKHHKNYKCRYYNEETDYIIKENMYVCKDS